MCDMFLNHEELATSTGRKMEIEADQGATPDGPAVSRERRRRPLGDRGCPRADYITHPQPCRTGNSAATTL